MEKLQKLTQNNQTLHKIGQGFCGTVWAADTQDSGLQIAIKRADGGPGRSISHEYSIHQHILSYLSFDVSTGYRVNIPASIAFLSRDSAHWEGLLTQLPEGFAACEALVNERIMPLGMDVRRLLAEKYCVGHDADAIAADEANECCLIRPYLGRRRRQPSRQNRLGFFSLRNFPFHLDQMEELALPVEGYVVAMADTLAFLHWVAGLDASDVEFVLAPSRVAYEGPSLKGKGFTAATLGEHDMWILDFDCCRRMDMDEGGVMQAARAFWRNDPFYPRPGSGNDDERLWKLFRRRFEQVSEGMLEGTGEEVARLPVRLMDKIEESVGVWTKSAVCR